MQRQRRFGSVLLVMAMTAASSSGQVQELSVPLGSYATELDPQLPDRSANIARAAARLDGVRLATGDLVSFDDLVGARRLGDGYLMAPAILDGELNLAPAGGICQLSSTLYNAALLAGLTIVERHPHARASHYVPPGRDATVARFHKDLKLRNDHEQPVRLEAFVLGDRVVVRIFGREPLPRSYRVETRILSSGPLEVETMRIATSTSGEAETQFLARDVYR